MAAEERLIFPLGFDVEGGIKEIENDWPRYHKKLQKMVDKTPLKIKLNIDSKGLDLKSLRDYNKLMKEAAKAAKDAADVESKRALARKRESDARVAEATEEARIAKAKAQSEMAELRLNDAKENGVRHTRNLNTEYRKQESYISRLIKRLVLYRGIYGAASMLRDIRETTAEFELQEVALGAIIQDAHEASVLFSQIKAAAVESPYQIKELVNYTKQLAAYGFKQNELFGTTMKLADISAGLGADMSRIILAVGQISAASVLKGTELRQLTELGIPMVELLADKFTELRGEIVSTGEVFEMISDKAVSFKMVEEILNDMTSAGGMFYDMQRKQAETLRGQWNNLKDSIAIAYDEIGNTAVVRSAMEGWITAVKTLVEEWRFFAGILGRVAVSMAAVKVVSFFLPTQITNTKMLAQATNQLAAAQERYNVAQGKGLAGQSAKWAMNHAKWMIKAANATTLFGRGMKQIAAFFAGGGWLSLLITGLTVAVSWFITARKEANRLNEELSKIGSEGSVKMEQSVRNFERLAKIAVDSVDGTKQQTEALKELQRTYGDIIPAQDLSIEKLREMEGGYEAVTQAIREKIAMQTLEQKISTIEEDYGSKINKEQKKFKEYLESTLGLSSDEINRVISNVSKQAIDGTINNANEAIQALKKAISEEVGMDVPVPKIQNWNKYYDFIKLIVERENRIKDETKTMEQATGTLGRYTDAWNAANKAIETSIGNITVSKNTKLYEEEVEKAKVKGYVDFLGQTIGSEIEGFDMSEYIDGNEIDFSSLFNLEGLSVQAKNAVRQVQTALQGLDGWKETLQSFAKDVTIDGITRKMSLYTDEEIGNMGNLKDTLEDVAKKWKEFDAEVTRYGKTLEGTINPEEEKQLKNKKAQAEEYKRQAYAILEYYNSLDLLQEKGTGKGEDPWIILMKNRASFMKDFQQGVEDLSKKMSEQNALFEEQGIMANRALSVGFNVKNLKGTAEELSQWYEKAIEEVTKKIKSMGADEGFAELSISAILKKDTKNQLIKSYQDLLQWLFNQKTDFETKQLEENLKKEIDRLAKAVARSKEAKDFYDKMLGMTGDRQLSADLTMSVYGGVGDDLKENIRRQLTEAFKGVDISDAISGENIDYKALEKLIGTLPKDMQANARKIVEEGIKANADIIQNLYKTLVKFEDYEDKRMTILRNGIEQRRKIEQADIAQTEKDRLKAASQNEESKALAKLDYEQFKSSDMYITMFENLDYVSSDTLKRMKERLLELKTTLGESLDPNQIKEIVTKMEDIDAELSRKNPFKTLAESIRKYKDEYGKVRRKQLESSLLTANEEQEKAQADVKAKQDAVLAQEELVRLAEEQYGKESESAAMQRILLEDAKAELAIAEQNLDAKDETLKNLNDQARAWRNIKKAIKEAIEGEDGIVDWLNSTQSMLDSIKSLGEGMGAGEEFSGWMEALSGIVGGAGSTATGIGQILSGQWAQGLANVVKGLSDVALGIFDASYVNRVADANAEIERQDVILGDLERAYQQLEKSAEDTFGTEYLDNYRERLELLQAEAEAYAKQIESEQSKGKKADPDAIEDYEEARQEALDKLDETQKEIAERMLGTDLGSAARSFAQAWLEAYKEFGNTSDAIGKKFEEMIDNMLVESAIAGVMKTALQPVFDLMKDMDIYDEDWIKEFNDTVAKAKENALVGSELVANALEQGGILSREMGENLSGISKDIATASEESILGLAAGINTQNFYISQIHAAVLRMEMLMQSGGTGVNIQDLVTIQNQHLAYLPNIAANTAGTLQRCEEILAQVTDIATNLGRVIVPNGTSSSHQVRTTLS